MFSFRYDHHLVADLLQNIAPIVDGWVAYDDRAAKVGYSNEPARHVQLVERARALGADWVLAVDPDERFENRVAVEIRSMIAQKQPVIWAFRFRELDSPTEYRADGIWGEKVQMRLFPILEGQVFSDLELHSPKFPIEPVPVEPGYRVAAGYVIRKSNLNLYHLKMITRERRVARRDLYNHLDPDNAYTPFGYDYLADDSGAALETIGPDRMYTPPHREDGGLWMPSPSTAEISLISSRKAMFAQDAVRHHRSRPLHPGLFASLWRGLLRK